MSRIRTIITPALTTAVLHEYLVMCKSAACVGRELGLSSTEVLNIVRRNGYLPRSHSVSHKKYSMDVSFFESIDTEAKAYVLGLLFADGSISGKNGRVSLVLQEGDGPLLHQINSLIQNTCPIRYTTRTTPSGNVKMYARLSFHDRKVAADLSKYGLIPNKTYGMQLPVLSPELYRHFIRGFWDGDGNIYLGKQTKQWRPVSVAATSNTIFCEQLRDIIETQIGIHFSVRKAHSDNEKISQLSLSNVRGVRSFLDFIYKDAHVYLQRKYNKYQDIVRWQDTRGGV